MPAHLDLAVLVTLTVVALSLGSRPLPVTEKPTSAKNSITTNDILYLESKDVLLQMLEKKLREIKDHKQRKSDSKNGNILPKNVDFKLKSNGISSVGDTELLLRYGKNGQGTVNLTADGISNVGKVQLTIGTGENGMHIPGLNNLFGGPVLKYDDKNDAEQLPHVNVVSLNSGFRRNSNITNDTETADKLEGTAEIDDATKGDEATNATTGTTSINFVAAANVTSNDINSKANVTNDNAHFVNGDGTAANSDANVAVASSPTVAENIAANTNNPVVASDTAIKSSTAPVNTVASNGQNLNAV